ncbi:MAG: cation diffusion facilitator family transporter [Desulfobacterales bacterium]|jgi:cation diffusion facilitator family transporter
MASTDIRAAKANHVTWVGFFVNLILVVFKLVAGILGNSAAMIADAIHSLSDFATDVVVLASIRVVSKPADPSHDYGHGKFETLAAAAIALTLLLVGGGLLWTGGKKIWLAVDGAPLEAPGIVAFVAAGVSVACKEWLYRYTADVGRKISSQAVIANAWHHRSDAFSSIGTMLGIGGAVFLGRKWYVLDPIAAVIVSFFIIKVAISILSGSIKELSEESLDEAIEDEILMLSSKIGGISGTHNLKTRRIGNHIAIDLHINVDGSLSVIDAHTLASQLEASLRDRFGEQTFVSIHVEPAAAGGKEE